MKILKCSVHSSFLKLNKKKCPEIQGIYKELTYSCGSFTEAGPFLGDLLSEKDEANGCE